MDKAQFEAIKELLGKKKKLLDTTTQVHSEVYDQTVRELLTVDGKVDFSLLDEIDMQEKFAEMLKAKYLVAARKNLGVKDEKGELEDEQLLTAYIGATSATLKQNVGDSGSGYNKKAHSDLAEGLRSSQDQSLTGVVYKDFKQGDIGDAIKHIGADGFVYSSKLDRPEAIRLIEQHNTGGLTEKMVKGRHYHKKKAA